MGDEDELTPEQKLSIAQNFINNSPPAQSAKVVEDVRTLVGPHVLTPHHEESMMRLLNKEQFAAVTLGNGSKVLLTSHGELPDGRFVDPATRQALTVNHAKLQCLATDPLPAAAAAEYDKAAKYRDPIDAAMKAHCEEWLPQGVVTTYGSASKITCCIASLAHDLSNYWSGRWWGEWTLEIGGSVGRLSGVIKCSVHYFEDGNVQLDDKIKFEAELPMQGDIGETFSKKVTQFEQEFVQKLESIYQTLSEQVLQSLRRRLPITRTKFDWEKASVAKLAMDLQSQAIKQ